MCCVCLYCICYGVYTRIYIHVSGFECRAFVVRLHASYKIYILSDDEVVGAHLFITRRFTRAHPPKSHSLRMNVFVCECVRLMFVRFSAATLSRICFERGTSIYCLAETCHGICAYISQMIAWVCEYLCVDVCVCVLCWFARQSVCVRWRRPPNGIAFGIPVNWEPHQVLYASVPKPNNRMFLAFIAYYAHTRISRSKTLLILTQHYSSSFYCVQIPCSA